MQRRKRERVLEGGNLPKNLLLNDNKHGKHSGVQAFLSGLFPQVAWGHRPNGSACQSFCNSQSKQALLAVASSLVLALTLDSRCPWNVGKQCGGWPGSQQALVRFKGPHCSQPDERYQRDTGKPQERVGNWYVRVLSHSTALGHLGTMCCISTFWKKRLENLVCVRV